MTHFKLSFLVACCLSAMGLGAKHEQVEAVTLDKGFQLDTQNSGVISELLSQINSFADSVSAKLDGEETFLSALVDMHLLLESDKKLENPLVATAFDRLNKKALRKVNNKDFLHLRIYAQALDELYQKAKDAELTEVSINYLPDFDLFLKHITGEIANAPTLMDALKDLYLILEDDAVQTSAKARQDVTKQIKRAMQMAIYADFDLYKEYVLEVIDKALNLQGSFGSVWMAGEENRKKLESLKSSMDKEAMRAVKRKAAKAEALRREIEQFNKERAAQKKPRKDKKYMPLHNEIALGLFENPNPVKKKKFASKKAFKGRRKGLRPKKAIVPKLRASATVEMVDGAVVMEKKPRKKKETTTTLKEKKPRKKKESVTPKRPKKEKVPVVAVVEKKPRVRRKPKEVMIAAEPPVPAKPNPAVQAVSNQMRSGEKMP